MGIKQTSLPGFWKLGKKTADSAARFNKRFKVQRGRSDETARFVSEEQCYGVLCCEVIIEDGYAGFTEIIGAQLSLEWAQKAVRILDEKYPQASADDWLQLEDEMRRSGYSGASFCLFNVSDAFGFPIAEQINDYTTAKLEDAPDGFITDYLILLGYEWLNDARQWRKNRLDSIEIEVASSIKGRTERNRQYYFSN